MADDYEDDAYGRLPSGDHPEKPRSRRRGRRAMTALVAVAAILGFGVVLVYAYNKGRSDGSAGKTPPLIQAREGPTKIRPEQPGGMKVPDRDKEVFSQLEAEGPENKVEKLLPPPEQPMSPPAPPEGSEAAKDEARETGRAAFEGRKDEDRAPMADAGAGAAVEPDPPTIAGASNSPPAADSSTTLAMPELPPPPPVATAPEPAPPAAAASKPPEQAVAAVPKPESAPARTSTSTRSVSQRALEKAYRIQVASLRTESAAKRSWDNLSAQHASVLGDLTPLIRRSDLGGKLGVFYRVQAGPFANRDAATAACTRLKSRKASCIVVNP